MAFNSRSTGLQSVYALRAPDQVTWGICSGAFIGKSGDSIIPPQIKTEHCRNGAKLYSSKVPLLARFRVSTLRWAAQPHAA